MGVHEHTPAVTWEPKVLPSDFASWDSSSSSSSAAGHGVPCRGQIRVSVTLKGKSRGNERHVGF
jgi:hypothetical protein